MSFQLSLRRLSELPPRQRLEAGRLLLLLLAAEASLRTTRLTVACRLFGLRLAGAEHSGREGRHLQVGGQVGASSRAPAGGGEQLPKPLSARELDRLRLLERLAARWPLASGPCLRRSLVAGHVLRRHGPVLQLGVARPATGLLAHAWVEVAGRSVDSLGGDGYVVLRS